MNLYLDSCNSRNDDDDDGIFSAAAAAVSDDAYIAAMRCVACNNGRHVIRHPIDTQPRMRSPVLGPATSGHAR